MSNSSSILEDFFNVKPKMDTGFESSGASNEFRPSAKKGQNGVYKAVVRFLPNPADPANKSIIAKNTVFLTNPVTQAKMEVDCPSTIGQPSPLQNTFFQLRGSSNAILQENSKQFSRKQRYASLIQVLSCESDPSIVNKILVWRYGYKIHEKLNSEMNPPMGTPRNPFDMFNGRPFSVVVKEVGGFNNFDNCGFFDLGLPDSAMRIVQNGQVYPVTLDTIATPEGKQMVFNYLKEQAPDMTPYEYHPWTPEVEQFVNQCIQIYSNPTMSVNAAAAAQNPGGGLQMGGMNMHAPAAAPTVQQPTAPSFPGFGASTPSMPSMNAQPAAAAAPSMPSMPLAQPAAPSMPAMPTMGLGTDAVSQQDPRGFNASGVGADVNALLNQGSKPAAAQGAMPMDLADVLNGTML